MVALAYAYESSFTDRVFQLLDRIDCRLAATEEEREDIFRLRYEAYMREKAISPNFARTFHDEYDELPNVWIFGLYFEGELASSIRIHVANREHPRFPSLETFSDLLEAELEAGKIIVDPTRFVTHQTLSRDLTGLPHLTLRLCWLAAQHFAADHFLVAIRTEHQAFYKRTFMHRLICPARPYPMLKAPISLMTVNQEEAAEQVYRRYPFFRSTHFERRMLFDQYPADVRAGRAQRANLQVVSAREA
jgi:hypothetical protein